MSGSMDGSGAVPFEPGQIVVLGAGPEHARRWYRTSVQRIDGRVVWLDGETEELAPVDVQPGDLVTGHTWRSIDALYMAEARVAFARLAPAPLHPRGRVVALTDLPDALNLRAQVDRPIETARREKLTPEFGVVFLDLAREDRERIIRFALNVQRDRRRLGLM